ncbi:hypothetical protein GGI42DRAFT_324058 [Trichoderma sp. SZMC 28013]
MKQRWIAQTDVSICSVARSSTTAVSGPITHTQFGSSIRQANLIKTVSQGTGFAKRVSFYYAAREVVEAFVRTADVIAGTPVAIMTLFGHLSSSPHPVRPSFVVVDEAGRLTEAMSLVPFAQYPDTPVLFVGDAKQFGPMAVAAMDRQYRALFTSQRKRSLLNLALEAVRLALFTIAWAMGSTTRNWSGGDLKRPMDCILRHTQSSRQ